MPDVRSKPTGEYVKAGDVFEAANVSFAQVAGHYSYVQVRYRNGWAFDIGISGEWAGRVIVEVVEGADMPPLTITEKKSSAARVVDQLKGNRGGEHSRAPTSGLNAVRPRASSLNGGLGGGTLGGKRKSGAGKPKKELQLSPEALKRVDRAAEAARQAGGVKDVKKQQEQSLSAAREAAAHVRRLLMQVQMATTMEDVSRLQEVLNHSLDTQATTLGGQAPMLREEADRALQLTFQRLRNAAPSSSAV